MRVKKDLELMDDILNIYDLSENSLKPYMYDSKDIDYMHTLLGAYERGKTIPAGLSRLVNGNLDKFIVVNYEDYPLTGTAMPNGTPIVNLAPLQASYITDLQSADLYSCFAYSAVFGNYIKNKPFKSTLVDQVALWMFNSFMGIYGKKSGLIGSYNNLTPKLRFIILLYTYDGLFGIKTSKKTIKKASGITHVDPKEMKLNYDFSDPVQFLKCIRDNGIISISENKFATDIIRVGKIYSIPMFEDLSRLFSTLLASVVKGNNVFPQYWAKKSKSIFEKMVFHGYRNLKIK